MGRWLDEGEEPQSQSLSVLTAYRAWSHWCAKLDGGGYQVRHVAARRERLSREQVVNPLCEVYARAVFEVSLALHFDGVDTQVDHHVLLQIAESFGLSTADEVYRLVSGVGPVVRRLDSEDAAGRLLTEGSCQTDQTPESGK